jgi:hypothetical protein
MYDDPMTTTDVQVRVAAAKLVDAAVSGEETRLTEATEEFLATGGWWYEVADLVAYGRAIAAGEFA